MGAGLRGQPGVVDYLWAGSGHGMVDTFLASKRPEIYPPPPRREKSKRGAETVAAARDLAPGLGGVVQAVDLVAPPRLLGWKVREDIPRNFTQKRNNRFIIFNARGLLAQAVA